MLTTLNPLSALESTIIEKIELSSMERSTAPLGSLKRAERYYTWDLLGDSGKGSLNANIQSVARLDIKSSREQRFAKISALMTAAGTPVSAVINLPFMCDRLIAHLDASGFKPFLPTAVEVLTGHWNQLIDGHTASIQASSPYGDELGFLGFLGPLAAIKSICPTTWAELTSGINPNRTFLSIVDTLEALHFQTPDLVIQGNKVMGDTPEDVEIMLDLAKELDSLRGGCKFEQSIVNSSATLRALFEAKYPAHLYIDVELFKQFINSLISITSASEPISKGLRERFSLEAQLVSRFLKTITSVTLPREQLEYFIRSS